MAHSGTMLGAVTFSNHADEMVRAAFFSQMRALA
jgi:hypothetical protein